LDASRQCPTLLWDDNPKLAGSPWVVPVSPFDRLTAPQRAALLAHLERALPPAELEPELLEFMLGADAADASVAIGPDGACPPLILSSLSPPPPSRRSTTLSAAARGPWTAAGSPEYHVAEMEPAAPAPAPWRIPDLACPAPAPAAPAASADGVGQGAAGCGLGRCGAGLEHGAASTAAGACAAESVAGGGAGGVVWQGGGAAAWHSAPAGWGWAGGVSGVAGVSGSALGVGAAAAVTASLPGVVTKNLPGLPTEVETDVCDLPCVVLTKNLPGLPTDLPAEVPAEVGAGAQGAAGRR